MAELTLKIKNNTYPVDAYPKILLLWATRDVSGKRIRKPPFNLQEA